MKTKLFTALLIFALISINAFAQSSRETVVELLNVSGCLDAIIQIEQMLDFHIINKKSLFENKEDYQEFVLLMKEIYNSQNAKKYLIEYFKNNTNEDTLNELIKAHNNPIFKEMRNIELRILDSTRKQEIIDYFQNYDKYPPPEDRKNKIINLDKVLGISDFTIRMDKNNDISIEYGINLLKPKDRQITIDEIIKKIESDITEEYKEIKKYDNMKYYLLIYKDVSDDKLNEYINYWNTPIGNYFNIYIMNAYDYTYSKLNEDLKRKVNEIKK